MVIGQRLRDLREQKKRTGLLRCYISRVENRHTVPSVETLEKLARALELRTYRLFTADANVEKPNIQAQAIPSPAITTKQDRELQVFAKLLSQNGKQSLETGRDAAASHAGKTARLISHDTLRAIERKRSRAIAG